MVPRRINGKAVELVLDKIYKVFISFHKNQVKAQTNFCFKETKNRHGQCRINACGDDKVHDFPPENQVVVDEARKRTLR